uniref:DUF2284 domain-containing protein n=1 Tax=viral metagenome TaxID=1070528 RepID=A0A6M3J910_9ZZZZ
MIVSFTNQELVMDMCVREWCKNPYYNHPKGCPNYGQRATCPPRASLFQDFIDTNKPMLLVAVAFKLGEHIENMRLKHPDWSEHQLRCVLYWQGGVRKLLRMNIAEALKVYPYMISTECPEAMGVHVINTVKRWLPIEFIPKDIAYKVAICGSTPTHKGGE